MTDRHKSDEREISRGMRRNRTGTIAIFLVAIAPAFAVGAVPSVAADTDSQGTGTLHEVIITAQKRAQNIQNVGISISSVSGSSLRDMGVTQTHDLTMAFPSVQLYSASGGDYGATMAIRGISTSDFSPTQESPNSFYMDDVYISATGAQTGIMFDVNRIEVDEGVQGTLFGRNSTGGLVNVLANTPTKTFDSYAELTGGEFNEAKFEGAISGPITDTIQGRLAVASQDNDGYDKNLLAGYPNLNTIVFRGVRGELDFEPTDNFDARFTLYYTHDNNREGFYSHINDYYDPNDAGRPAPLPSNINAWGSEFPSSGPGLDWIGYRFPGAPGPQGEVGFIGWLHRDFVVPSFRFNWHLPNGATLSSITAFQVLHFNYDESCSGEPVNNCQDPYREDMKQWSEELRLAKTTSTLSWVTGLYWLNIHQNDWGGFLTPYWNGTPLAFDTADYVDQATSTEAAFGQLEYNLDEHWRPTVGLRVEHDKKNYSSYAYWYQVGDGVSQDTVYNPPLLVQDFSPATVGNLAEEDTTDWSGKVAMDYIWSQDLLLYASVSRGLKGAGFNDNLTGEVENDQMRFRPEHVLDYELGQKWTSSDHRLRFNSDAFYYDYHDYQGFELLPHTVVAFTTNNNARFYGVEFQMDAAPVDGLLLHLGGVGMDSRVFNVSTAELGITDQRAPQAPKWTANARISYTWNLGQGALTAAWSTVYLGGRFYSIDNTPIAYVHSYIDHDVSLAYSLEHWQIRAGVTDLTNKALQTAAYDTTTSGGYGLYAYLPPRWWTVTVRYQFGE